MDQTDSRPPSRRSFRSLRMPVLLLGPASRSTRASIVFANEAFLRLSGFSNSEVLGRGWRSFAGEQADREALDAVDASLNAGEGHDAEILFRRRNGSSFWGALTVSPILDEAGRIRLFTVMLSDVSVRKQAERLLEEQLEQKTALLHEVEHRVKNSLQMTASLVLLKARRLQNPEARKVSAGGRRARRRALAAAHRLLYASDDAGPVRYP